MRIIRSILCTLKIMALILWVSLKHSLTTSYIDHDNCTVYTGKKKEEE